MRFPEWLYALLPNDEGSQKLGVVWRESTSSQAAATVSVDVYTVPADKCLVLTNLTGQFIPGAAQNVQRRRFMADPPAGTVRYNILDDEADGSVNSLLTNNWQGEVVIPGGWKVKVEGLFSGAVANSVNGELHGYLIPRGTFIFG